MNAHVQTEAERMAKRAELLQRYLGKDVREILPPMPSASRALSRGIEPRTGTVVDVAHFTRRSVAAWRVRVQWPKRCTWLELDADGRRWEVVRRG